MVYAGEAIDSEVIKRALEYLKTRQNEDGGMRYFGNASSNAASDSWTIQALVSAGVNQGSGRETMRASWITSLVCKSKKVIQIHSYASDNPGYMTASAIMALLGKPFPVKPLTEIEKIPEKTRPIPGLEASLALLALIAIVFGRRVFKG